MIRRLGFVACLGTIAVFAWTAVASASYHLNFIRQIHPDNSHFGGMPPQDLGGEWVELQMYADGENQVAGKVIRTFFGDGGLRSQYVIASRADTPNAPNGQNQRTILISSLFTPEGVTADYVAPVDELQMTGQDGAVCYTENNPPTYTPIDCVAYGNFTGSLPVGTPAVATPFGSTLERSITRGCPTALDPLDDSNNSVADFALSTNPPRNNATPPTETVCPPGSPGSTSSTPIPPGGATLCAGKPITMSGTNGADKLSGTPAADVIAGQLGNDVIKGLAGKDTLCGGLGRDRLLGAKGNDLLLGEAGKDTLKGGAGKDKLKGGPAADMLEGGPGKDKLKGGAGKDVQVQ
jgi:RTX calcium-binding nonapeptide repeat (4 copies)